MTVETTSLAERCRHRFPIFEQRVYINSCSQGALSDAVRASYEQYLADWDEHGAPWEYWVERQETARAVFAALVNADPDEIAVTTSLSAGVSALARGLDVDFLGAGVLKYLLGSAGLGFFYCRRDLVERVWPTQTGWFADEHIFAMDHTDYSPAHTAARFQSGTPPVPAIYAGIAGVELMQEIGIAATREHVNGLNARLIDGLDELGATLVTPRAVERRGALLCIRS